MAKHIKLYENWLSDLAAKARYAFTGEVEAEKAEIAKAEEDEAELTREFEREIIDISGKAEQPTIQPGRDLDKYFVVHHTAGRGTADAVVDILNNRGLGVQWIIDREGKVYRSFPEGMAAWHTGHQDQKDAPSDLQNNTAQGVEVVAKDDADVLPIQVLAAWRLLKYLGYSKDAVWGHGEVTHNKQATEGQTITDFWRENWDKSLAQVTQLLGLA
jgi:N-acetyl-anhydromuramyl-L-alanine amidase AmpD